LIVFAYCVLILFVTALKIYFFVIYEFMPTLSLGGIAQWIAATIGFDVCTSDWGWD
jgi:hypothetical protein